MSSDTTYKRYVDVLKEELIPAMGCTEPIAVAYAAALAKRYLNAMPQSVLVEVSGNVVKNTKSVVVPNTGGLRGIEAAVAAGVVAGDPDKELRVIAQVSPDDVAAIADFLKTTPITVRNTDTGTNFDIRVSLEGNGHSASVHITDYHTNVVEICRDNSVLERQQGADTIHKLSDHSFMSVAGIVDFAECVAIADIKETLDAQRACNTAISEEGLRGDYGANIGSVLLAAYGDGDVRVRARAKAAAGSDARMSGCEMPVIINSGSGNQGITASVPVIEFARELGVLDDTLYRALVISNLTAIHIKTSVGRLSAYCGAISAGSGSGAGIAYLYGGGYEAVAHTLVNSLAIASGIVCDGAKASCAAKIASGVDAGILGYYMYRNGQQFYSGEGLVIKGVENTIANIGRLARDGMKETDKEILRIMMDC